MQSIELQVISLVLTLLNTTPYLYNNKNKINIEKRGIDLYKSIKINQLYQLPPSNNSG